MTYKSLEQVLSSVELPDDLARATRTMNVTPEFVARCCLGERVERTPKSTIYEEAILPKQPTLRTIEDIGVAALEAMVTV